MYIAEEIEMNNNTSSGPDKLRHEVKASMDDTSLKIQRSVSVSMSFVYLSLSLSAF